MILKKLLNSKIDFEYWSSGYSSDFVISSNEYEPKHYPCVIVYKIEETNYSIRDIVYYEFVYLDDFEKTEDTSKEIDNTNI